MNNFDWMAVKEKLRIAYAKLSQLLVFLAACFYLLACVIGGKPVGPKDYVGFAYHCVQWVPERTSAPPAAPKN